MKYIVTQGEDGREELFLFPDAVHHDAFAEVLSGIRSQTTGNWHRVFRMPIAAGFVSAAGACYGCSETLDLASRPEQDTALLAKQYGALPAPHP